MAAVSFPKKASICLTIFLTGISSLKAHAVVQRELQSLPKSQCNDVKGLNSVHEVDTWIPIFETATGDAKKKAAVFRQVCGEYLKNPSQSGKSMEALTAARRDTFAAIQTTSNLSTHGKKLMDAATALLDKERAENCSRAIKAAKEKMMAEADKIAVDSRCQ